MERVQSIEPISGSTVFLGGIGAGAPATDEKHIQLANFISKILFDGTLLG
jgi:hypothetical protein